MEDIDICYIEQLLSNWRLALEVFVAPMRFFIAVSSFSVGLPFFGVLYFRFTIKNRFDFKDEIY